MEFSLTVLFWVVVLIAAILLLGRGAVLAAFGTFFMLLLVVAGPISVAAYYGAGIEGMLWAFLGTILLIGFVGWLCQDA